MVIDWSLRAERDLSDIIDYITPESPAGARRMAERILKRVDDLLQFPDHGVARRGGERRLDVAHTRI